jgi:hypothetical protein
MEIKWQQISSNIWFYHCGTIIIRVYKDKDKIWYINLPNGSVVTKANLRDAKIFTENYMEGFK